MLVVGSDGLWDNLSDEHILDEVCTWLCTILAAAQQAMVLAGVVCRAPAGSRKVMSVCMGIAQDRYSVAQS